MCIIGKKSRIYIAALIAAVLSALGSFYCFAAHADEPTVPSSSPAIIKHDTDCVYAYLDYPTAIYARDGVFTVADGSAAYAFDTRDLSSPVKSEIARNTQKLIISGNTVITLGDGSLFVDGEELSQINGFIDFTVSDSVIYAITGDDDGSVYAFTLGETADDTDAPTSDDKQPAIVYGAKLYKIAAGKSDLYLSVDNDLNKYLSDIVKYTISEDSLTDPRICLTESGKILQLEANANGAVCLTRDGITSYSLRDGMLEINGFLPADDVVAISADNASVYGISQLKSVFVADMQLSSRRELIASAHNEKGFFRANAGIYTRKQMIAVADELNNRVQLIDADECRIINGVVRPKAVTIDYAGNVYVAHSGNKISVYDGVTTELKFELPSQNLGFPVFTDLKINSDNDVYALARSGQIYKIANGSAAFEPLGKAKYKAVAVAQKDNALYAVTNDNLVEKLTVSGEVRTIQCDYEVADICTDHDGSIYILSADGRITKYKNVAGYYTEAITQTPGFVRPAAIEMCTVNFDGDIKLEYGDLLVSDTGAHAVKSIDRDTFAVNENFDITADAPQADPSPTRPNYDSAGILFTVSACDVYACEAELNMLAALPDGTKVIIPDYDVTAKFNMIIADNISAGYDAPPIIGYIYTSLISKRMPYTAPPSETCYSYFPSVTVYKYPSVNAPKVASVTKSTKLTLMDFAFEKNGNDIEYGYSDNFVDTDDWYRVIYEYENERYEGYVISDTISMRGETPDDRNVYPRVNARIISKEKDKKLPATLYEKDADGKMIPVADSAYPPLATGTEVEVIGTFDTSKKYTLIKYYHEGIGTVQFYVETVNLKYDGINRATVIAVVIIILTVLLGAGLLIRFLHVKRTRKMTDSTKI